MTMESIRYWISILLPHYNRHRIIFFPLRKNLWEENSSKEIPHLYSVTALGWKRDGSRVAAGSLCGGVELFESVLKRAVWNNKFEMTYVGPSQVRGCKKLFR